MGFSLPFKKKEQQKDHYFGLYLTHEHAVGFVFEIIDGKAAIIAKEMCKYSNSWENILEDVDKLISILESETNVHLEQSIFFVHSYMIEKETHEIKNPYKEIIKNIAKQLELKPLGYIEVHEAVKDHLQIRDEAPLNMIFVELDSQHVGVYVYKGGKLIMSEHVARTTDLIDDVSQLFTQVHSHTLLPSKMIVYGMIKIDDNVEKLLHHKWDTDLFIQHPRVELLKGEELYASLGSIFAQQMGADDIEEDAVPDKEPVMIKEEQLEEETFGFIVGKDVTQEVDIEPPADDVFERPQKAGKILPALSMKNPFKGKDFLTGIKGLGKSFKSLSLPAFNYVWIVILVVLIVSFVAFEYFLHTAEVIVFMPAQTAEKTVELSLSVSDGEELSLRAHALSSDATEQKETTGKRDVGEKAKGLVNILNFDNVEKSFPAGTKLETGGLTFTTDSDVRVASSSSVTSGGAKQSGRAKVSATATAIGPESNIPVNKELKIAGLSDALYVAQVADTPFKGGTKKQVRTVAKKDLDELKAKLSEKAQGDDESKISSQISAKEELLTQLTEVTVNEIEYSKEVSEEADTVSATATTEITYYTFEKEKMKKALIDELKAAAPAGFTLETSKITYSVSSATKNEEAQTATVEVEAKGQAVKDVEQEAVKDTIALSLTGNLEESLKDRFSATGYEVKKTSPPFLGLWTPFFKKNISVTISSK